MGDRFEYRVVWKRRAMPQKNKRFATLKAAQRRIRLLGPEPWTAVDRDPDEQYCCSGHECGCGGETVREHFQNYGKPHGEDGDGMPPIIWVRLERRPVVAWEAAEALAKPRSGADLIDPATPIAGIRP